jgi:osmotically-inducible protein OsmY
MKTDEQLQVDVLEELRWEPTVTASEIGVSVSKGVVMLTGTVSTYAEKCAAERAVRRVAGVQAIAEEIRVKLTGIHQRSDEEVAQTLERALQSHVWVPSDVQATVENGWVTLGGEVTWQFQRKAATNVARFLAGVKGVTNRITIRPRELDAKVEKSIDQALKRNADIDAKGITVSAYRGKATLSGNVRTFADRDRIERVVWNAPGVVAIENKLIVLW